VDFGPSRKSYHPEEPFVRLYRDGIWKLNKESGEVKVDNKWLLNNHIAGGFSAEVTDLLLSNKYLIREVAELVLVGHFPESMHEDILTAVGLEFEYETRLIRKRDPQFRDRILAAYEYKCAVCGFNVRLGHQLVGIEAAHIKWHQAGGPDREDNGVALCSMHHKLYDRGVFTIAPSKQVIVSKIAHGSSGFDEWLMRYHGQRIRNPVDKCYYPEDEYIAWNVREVFKGEGRAV
jgi:putative restriction endonuclease